MTHVSNPPQIIARAFKKEPVVLYALALQPNGRYVNVCRDYPPPSYIGWPLVDAFDYDIDDFTPLWEAYSSEDEDKLDSLYAELENRPKRFLEHFRC